MKKEPVIYTHYGHSTFDINLFNPIKNKRFGVKPVGGFWASRQNAKYGWKDWNKNEGFVICDKNNKISFTLKSDSHVLEIHSVQDVDNIIEKYHVDLPNDIGFTTMYGQLSDKPCFIDFEKIAKDYDAIECFVSDDSGLYDKLYTWDCDSILILNPDIIEPILEKEQSIADKLFDEEDLVSPLISPNSYLNSNEER